MSRTIRLLIMPDHDGTVEDSDWELIEPEAKAIAEDLATWADQVRDQVRNGERPSLPEGAKARTKERWLPLKRVAAAAGGRWPDVVDELVVLDMERMRIEREEGIVNEKPHVTLLKHVSEVWVKDATFHSTDDLISMLVARYPTSWGPSDKYPKGLTAQRFGRMLVKNFGVYSDRTASKSENADSKVRGYSAKSLDRALRSVRMTPILEPAKPVEPVEPAPPPAFTSGFVPPTGPGRCDSCGWDTAKQGHQDGCQQTKVAPS